MYEVINENHNGAVNSYIVVSPTGGFIEKYKINHLIPTSNAKAKALADGHATRLNNVWHKRAA